MCSRTLLVDVRGTSITGVKLHADESPCHKSVCGENWKCDWCVATFLILEIIRCVSRMRLRVSKVYCSLVPDYLLIRPQFTKNFGTKLFTLSTHVHRFFCHFSYYVPEYNDSFFSINFYGSGNLLRRQI